MLTLVLKLGSQSHSIPSSTDLHARLMQVSFCPEASTDNPFRLRLGQGQSSLRLGPGAYQPSYEDSISELSAVAAGLIARLGAGRQRCDVPAQSGGGVPAPSATAALMCTPGRPPGVLMTGSRSGSRSDSGSSRPRYSVPSRPSPADMWRSAASAVPHIRHSASDLLVGPARVQHHTHSSAPMTTSARSTVLKPPAVRLGPVLEEMDTEGGLSPHKVRTKGVVSSDGTSATPQCLAPSTEPLTRLGSPWSACAAAPPARASATLRRVTAENQPSGQEPCEDEAGASGGGVTQQTDGGAGGDSEVGEYGHLGGALLPARRHSAGAVGMPSVEISYAEEYTVGPSERSSAPARHAPFSVGPGGVLGVGPSAHMSRGPGMPSRGSRVGARPSSASGRPAAVAASAMPWYGDVVQQAAEDLELQARSIRVSRVNWLVGCSSRPGPFR